MAKEVKVAIIDNGVNEIYIKGIVKSITVDEQGICIDDTSKWIINISAWNKLCNDTKEILPGLSGN